MTLNEAIATQPMAIRIWIGWLMIVMVSGTAILLAWKDTRKDGLVAAAATLANILMMRWLYEQVGYVRLLGLPHILAWTPLAAYLFLRLKQGGMPVIPRRFATAFLISITISLGFDYVDVARWLLGERAPLIPG